MEKQYIRVFLKEDIKGTYFIGSTILEDGKSADHPYPKEYKKLVNSWDNLFPHLPFTTLKNKVTREASKKGYGVEITKEEFD